MNNCLCKTQADFITTSSYISLPETNKQQLRSFNKLILWALTLVMCFAHFSLFGGQVLPKKEVLYINSYHRGHDWSDEVENGIRETLMSAGEPIELSVVYLDAMRFEATSVREKVADILNIKNVAESADLIITSDTEALDFALSNQGHLFPKQPILFTAVSDVSEYQLSQTSNTTGILEFTSFNTAIELALSLHPGTKSLVFVGSTKETHNQRILDVIKNDIVPLFKSKFDIEILTDKSIDKLDIALGQLPSNSIVFAISNTLQKSDGNLYSPTETARILSSVTSLPLYSYWHSHIGHGPIGGQIVTGHNQGKAAGQLALQVISSNKNLPKPKALPASLFFDIEVMKKYGLTKDDLPEGTQFIHDKPAIWHEYQNEVLTTLAILFGLVSAVLACILFTQRQKQTIAKISDDNTSIALALDLNKEALEDVRQLLREVSIIDDITGLYNVRYFDEMLDKELRRASRYDTPLSLLLVSIDKFQSYIRHNGEEQSETLLVEFSNLLSNICQRSSDVIAFIQEGKFAVVLPHTVNNNGLIVTQKIHEKLAEANFPFILSSTGMVTVSIGLSSFERLTQHINPQHMYNTSEMLRVAAEKEGGNTTKADCVRLNTEQSLLLNIKNIHIT